VSQKDLLEQALMQRMMQNQPNVQPMRKIEM